MKKFLMIVFIMLLMVLGLPVLLLGLMYEGDTLEAMPLELYTEDADGFGMLYARIDEALAAAQDDEAANLTIAFDEDVLNTLIFNFVRGDAPFKDGLNPDYLPSVACETAACGSILEETFIHDGRRFIIRLEGVFVRFHETGMRLHAALALSYGDRFTFKTVVTLDLEHVSDTEPGTFTLAYAGAQIGRVPVPSRILNTAMTLFDRVTSYDFDAVIQADSDSPFTIDRQALQVTFDALAMIEQATATVEDDPGADLALVLLETLWQDDLIHFGLDGLGLALHVRLSHLRVPPAVTIPASLQAQQDDAGFMPEAFVLQDYLKRQLETWLIEHALGGTGRFRLPADVINGALYHEAGGFERFQYEFDYRNDAGNQGILWTGLEALWFDFAPEDVEVVAGEVVVFGLFDFGGLKSRLALTNRRVDGASDGVLVLELTQVTLGEHGDKPHLTISQTEAFTTLFANMAVEPFMSVDANARWVIDGTALLDAAGTTGVWSVHAIDMDSAGIFLEVTPSHATLQETFEAMTAALRTVFSSGLSVALEAAIDDSPESSALLDQLTQIETVLTSGQDPDAQAITLLLAQIDALSSTARAQFTDTLESLLDATVLARFNADFRD
ncbi:MAG: hypothetical protein EA374_04390 [Acholeplasmatales bacterium]|nr:MAG: hypothetical protein EA374_04390 [Acholeplasmatales bacterium]